ncbi:hypothetical protein [Methylocella sp. CPCC 101449]|uniref:hypothetical protein n=1 Tax=Methylocella sp. CPCC 101449 TaxID=2987531 RepID=UPI0028918D4A|nr:hypothetical protein [Methylocella sp. CPCC 101449]MDT2022837.1 hypothetical protein [Methylocella sp. CPCC 101449]
MSNLPVSVDLLRALEVMDVVPAGCVGIPVRDHSFSPHLKPGEIAIVDTTDKSPAYGELFVLTFMSGRGPIRQIVQLRRSGFAGSDSEQVGYWYAFAFRGQEKPNAVMMDGPLRHDCWPAKCVGRVIGVIVGGAVQ